MNKTDEQLKFIIQDCGACLIANPLGHKSEHYLALARQCQNELNRRERLRGLRHDVKMITDPYMHKMLFGSNKSEIKRLPKITPWAVDTANDAILSLGLLKQFN